MTHPLALERALSYLDEWLALPVVRIIQPTSRHQREFARMLRAANAVGNLVSDAHLAALAVEHHCTVALTDHDFQKFPDLHWFDPLAG